MLDNLTTGEKALIGATALGIAALVFHKPTRNAVGLSDRVKPRIITNSRGTKKVRISRNPDGYGGYVYNAAYIQISNTGIGKSEDLLQLKEFKSKQKAVKWAKAQLD